MPSDCKLVACADTHFSRCPCLPSCSPGRARRRMQQRRRQRHRIGASNREYTLHGQISRSERRPQAGQHQARRHQGLHAGDDDALQGARREGIRRDRAGDLIDATLVVVSNDAYLKDVKKVGHGAAREDAPAVPRRVRSPGAICSRTGEPVPNTTFVDQDGKKRDARVVQGLGRRADVHLHALPDADLLSADGPQLRRAAGEAQGRPRR